MEFTYRGLSATLEHITVTDEELARHMLRLRSKRCVPVTDRAAQLGDELVFDYAGFLGTEQFEGGTAQGQTLTLGSGKFIPGFEEQLVGAQVGETREVHVTFPTNYHAAEIAGKAAVFRCTIHEIRAYCDYTNDDEFAREVGHCDSYDEMLEQVRRSLQDYHDECAEQELQQKLADMVCDSFDYELTDEEHELALKQTMDVLSQNLASKGLTIAAYLQFRSITEQELIDELRAEADRSYKTELALEKIIELEHIEATADEIAEFCNEICESTGATMEQFVELYNAETAGAIAEAVCLRKAMACIRDNANISVVEC